MVTAGTGGLGLEDTKAAKKENRRYEAGDDHPGMDYAIVVSRDKHTKKNCSQVKLAERGQKILV